MNIKTSPCGKVIDMATGYKAFVPNPLPPAFEWNTQLVHTLSRTDHLLGRLGSEGRRFLNPYLFTRPFAACEATLSSKIEGTQSTIGELMADDAGGLVNREPDDVEEVKNYITALDYGIKRLDTLPMSLRLIREVHKELMQGGRGSHATPGEFRLTQNWIGSPGCTLKTAKYVPPPPSELMATLGSFETFLHDRSLPPLIHIAMCHYQFEAIHPFLDGNGRVGRLLIILLMIEHKLLPYPLLYLSAFFEATRDEYYRHLYSVSSNGTWHEWLAYFLKGVATQTHSVMDRIHRIKNTVDGWKEIHKGASYADLYDLLISNPFIKIKTAAEKLGISFTAAQRALVALEKSGIVTEVTGSARGRLYCAKKLLGIFEEPAITELDETML